MTDPRLTTIQSLREVELCELVLLPLLEEMGYEEIRYTHGPQEYGKDIVFSQTTPLEGKVYYCATVKRTKLDGTVSTSRAIREVHFQVSQALSAPFVHPATGHPIEIAKVFVITPCEITQQTIRSIADELRVVSHRIQYIDGPQLLTLLTRYLPSLLVSLDDAESRYLYSLFRRFNDQPSFARFGSARKGTVFDLYTGGDLSELDVDEISAISFAQSSGATTHPKTITVYEASPFTVILADVGAGKTTLLQRQVIQASGFGVESSSIEHDAVPLYIPLSHYAEHDLRSGDAFQRATTDYLHREGFGSFSLAHAKQYRLLLDGFDELISSHSDVTAYIQSLANCCAGVVVTSRPSRYPMLGAPFKYYRLNLFSDDDIGSFLLKWFDDASRAQDILKEIMVNAGVKHFCRTPLFLTLYAILASRGKRGKLPTRRTDLYVSIVDLLLGEWDDLRDVKNDYSSDLKQYALEMLAYNCQQSVRTSFTWKAVRDVIKLALNSRDEHANPGDVFDEILYRTSLVRPNQQGGFEFAHLSIQEFFCARRLVRYSDVSKVLPHLADEWWRNTLTYYFGLTRSMDSIRIPSNARKRRGIGLPLIEFLSDADFTSASKCQEIIGVFALDVLASPVFSSHDMDACHRIGDEIIPSLIGAVGIERSNLATTRCFRILAELGSKAALDTLFGQNNALSRLDIDSMLSILDIASGLVADSRWSQFTIEVLMLLKGGLTQSGRLRPRVKQELAVRIHNVLARVEGSVKFHDVQRTAVTVKCRELRKSADQFVRESSSVFSTDSVEQIMEEVIALANWVDHENVFKVIVSAMAILVEKIRPWRSYRKSESKTVAALAQTIGTLGDRLEATLSQSSVSPDARQLVLGHVDDLNRNWEKRDINSWWGDAFAERAELMPDPRADTAEVAKNRKRANRKRSEDLRKARKTKRDGLHDQ